MNKSYLPPFRVMGALVLGLMLGGSPLVTAQVADGTYKIVNRYSGQCLSVSGAGTTKGTPLIQRIYDSAGDSQWTLTSLGGGQYKLTGVASGLAINVVNNSLSAKAGVQLWPYSSAGEDQFTLVDAGGGYYTPVFVSSGMALQASTDASVNPNGALTLNQSIVQDAYSATSANAQWIFLPVTDGSTAGARFAMCTLPDTQKEVHGVLGSTPQMFYDQINWINTNRTSLNIQYVAGLGDITDYGGDAPEWTVATNGLYALDNTVPYGALAGNHDFDSDSPVFTLNAYNTYFGVSHFINKSYYGGHSITTLGNENNNFYHLISASGLDFVIVHMRFHSEPSVPEQNSTSTFAQDIAWANSVIQAFPNRRAIFVTHQLIDQTGAFSVLGQAAYDALKDNANLFLMLCGHVAPCKEAVRSDTYNGHTVYTMLADYQDAAAPDFGGNGILRLLEFYPKENLISSKTYCVENGQTMFSFSVPYQMHGAAAPPVATASAYYMLVNNNSGLAVDLIGANTAEGAVVNQGTYAYGSQEQQWALVPTENMDHFRIISAVTGKALSVTGSSTAQGAQIVDAVYVGNDPGQQWDLIDVGNGWFNIRNVNSGMMLDDAHGNTANGSQLWQYHNNGSIGQQWRLQPWGNYYLQTATGSYVTTSGSSTATGTPIVLGPGAPNTTYQWRFSNVSNGWLQVVFLARTSTNIQLTGAPSTAAGAPFQLYLTSTHGVKMVPQTNGFVKFYWDSDGMTWDVPGDSPAAGTLLQQNTDTPNSNEQLFRLQRVP